MSAWSARTRSASSGWRGTSPTPITTSFTQPFFRCPTWTPALPDCHPTGRLTQFYDQVTTDVASLRSWRPGDAYRRIHWPYTARMNTPMVKEFDVGQAAQFWVLLDLQRSSHHYGDAQVRTENRNGGGNGEPFQFQPDNTEELAVSLAASLAQRLMEISLPVGMAVNAENGRLLRPDNGPDHLSRMMETLAAGAGIGGRSVARVPAIHTNAPEPFPLGHGGDRQHGSPMAARPPRLEAWQRYRLHSAGGSFVLRQHQDCGSPGRDGGGKPRARILGKPGTGVLTPLSPNP